MADLPDYYSILEISPSATTEQIRTAYKKAALKWHPDRVSTDSPERATRTRKFQRINDAYYTLSDAVRRRDYDDARKFHHGGTPGSFEDDDDAEYEDEDEDFEEEVPHSTANSQFQSAFEEMMRDNDLAEDGSGQPTKKFWSIIGGISGAALGFILGNWPGATAGGFAGHAAGRVRDAKGKSVFEVFQGLDQPEKARLLAELAKRVAGYAIS